MKMVLLTGTNGLSLIAKRDTKTNGQKRRLSSLLFFGNIRGSVPGDDQDKAPAEVFCVKQKTFFRGGQGGRSPPGKRQMRHVVASICEACQPLPDMIHCGQEADYGTGRGRSFGGEPD